MNEISAIALVTAFGAGIVSFLSPCVLPLVPGYVSYVAGDRISQSHRATDSAWRLSALGLSFCFVLGFSTVFILLGAGAAGLGQLLLRHKNEANIVGGGLGVILTWSAVTATVSSGVALLGVYSLGLGIPFVATAMFTDAFLAWRKPIARIGRPLQIGAGAGMGVMGF